MNAPADAENTEQSREVLKPVPTVKPRAKIINIAPLNTAVILVLKPMIKSIPKMVSNIVAIHPAIGTRACGIKGVKAAT